jgi:serine/threonine protein kinase/uncharacterized protein HemY
MNHTDWQQIEQILTSVLELREDERSARIEQLCAGNPSLRNEVLSLLAAHNDAGSFLEIKTQISTGSALNPSLVSKQLGPYRLLQPIGHGGMGTVYRAERADGQFEKQVAVKVVPAAVHSQELLRRFTSEQQILATLEHPNIARLLDAGVSSDGVPYLVMEYVEGVSITDYCRDRRLSIQQRLRLFQTVCSTVHYAHQHLIVHRDIKPANILVTNEGIPKLLDFGIAKLLDPLQNPGAGSTRSIFNPMTPDYASPEQARGEALTTATDVYSLGVILYELLASQRPYSVVDKSSTEAVRMICELEPEKPSALVRIRMKRNPGVPREAGLSSELDAVVAKAMRKDPQQRYGSAQDLAEDISRYLGGLTVLAHRGSLRYSVTKLIGRHKLAAASALMVLTLTVAGVSAIVWQAQVAIRERENAKAVNDFLQNDLLAQAGAWNQAGPGSRPDPDIKVRTALDRAAANVAGKFAKQPLVEASIRQTIGSTYIQMGLYPEAQEQLQQALEIRRSAHREEHDDLEIMNSLAYIYDRQGKYLQTEQLLLKSIEIERRLLGEKHPDTLGSINNLGLLYRHEGKFALAEPLLARVVELRRKTQGEDNPETLICMNNLGSLYRDEGKYEQAELLLTKSFEVQRRVRGEDNPETVAALANLGVLYRAEEKQAQAEPILFEALEKRRRLLGQEHPDTLSSMYHLGLLYFQVGKYAKAEPLLANVLEARRRLLGPASPFTTIALASLGKLRLEQQRYIQAESLLREALDGQQKRNPDSWERYDSQSMLAASLAAQSKFADAEPLLKDAYRGLVEREAAIPSENRSVVEQANQRIIQLYESWGKPKEADVWRREHPSSSPARAIVP